MRLVKKQGKRAAEEQARRCVERVGLGDKVHQPQRVVWGQQQWVAIAPDALAVRSSDKRNRRPPLGDSMSVNVVIVGAGVIGSSLAHELTRRGASVTVINAAESGTGTTAATYGWVNANYKSPDEYRDLNQLGLRAHERALHAPTRGTWFHQTGTIELAQSRAEIERIQANVHDLARNDYDATMLSAAQISDLEPGLCAEHVLGGALYAREGWIDATTMCSSLLHRAREQGATFIPYQEVTDITSQGIEATTPDGILTRYPADVIVLAAGNGTRDLLAPMGITFPIIEPARQDESGDHPTVGLISTTGRIDSGIQHLIRARDIALRPASNGGITFTDHPTGAQWDRTDPRIWTIPDELLNRARRLFPALERTSTESVIVGNRVLPEDGLTIADWVDNEGRIYAIATHSGVTLAAHLAEVVSEEIIAGRRHESLEPFGLARFAAHLRP